jgi:tetratricopeptide (TPR) repeat protein
MISPFQQFTPPAVEKCFLISDREWKACNCKAYSRALQFVTAIACDRMTKSKNEYFRFGAAFVAFFRKSTQVTANHSREARICLAACVFIALATVVPIRTLCQERVTDVRVQGYVRDSDGKPAANATVILQFVTATEAPGTPQTTQTASDGAYRFTTAQAGAYTLRVEKNGYAELIVGPINLAPAQMKTLDLALVSSMASDLKGSSPGTAAGRPNAQIPEFFDEPQFTVAGVTQATNSGGHGSDAVQRTSEALARATVSLSKESAGDSSVPMSAATEGSLRDAVTLAPQDFKANLRLGNFLVKHGKAAEAVPFLQRASELNPRDADTHHLLGDAEEKSANSLEAVREYRRAAELDSSETNLFDWGTELLMHRALEPATEIFTEGSRLFPRSERMFVALGVSWYARGSYDHATQCLANASDLAPDNPMPYLFLGKMQSAELAPSEQLVKLLARFARLQPDNALADYYYAVAVWKQSASAANDALVESLLEKAVHLDPKLGAAYLQLGILYSQREDFSRAIPAYQRAIEVGMQPDQTLEEAHYRLAQAYQRTGDKTKAQAELELHSELNLKLKEVNDHERQEIQEFLISLKPNSTFEPQP